MDPQFTHLTHFIFRSCLSRTLSTSSPHSSIIRNPPHRARHKSSFSALFKRRGRVHMPDDDRTPPLGHTIMLDFWLNGI
jgi:hypothetical protein